MNAKAIVESEEDGGDEFKDMSLALSPPLIPAGSIMCANGKEFDAVCKKFGLTRAHEDIYLEFNIKGGAHVWTVHYLYDYRYGNDNCASAYAPPEHCVHLHKVLWTGDEVMAM